MKHQDTARKANLPQESVTFAFPYMKQMSCGLWPARRATETPQSRTRNTLNFKKVGSRICLIMIPTRLDGLVALIFRRIASKSSIFVGV
jgi:hypothetical protein